MAARLRRLIALLPLILAACAAEPVRDAPDTPPEEVRLVPGMAADAPLLVVLHGPEGSAARLERLAAFTISDEGWTLAFPEAGDRGWMDPARDEAARVAALVRRLTSRGLADPRRVVITGFSDGGQLALRIACETPALVSGVAAVMASLPEGADCLRGAPVPILLMNATTDPILPFEGGAVARPELPSRERAPRLAGPVLSARQTAAILARRNGCGAAREIEIPDLFPDDGARAVHRVYEGCEAATSQFVIEGGGHAWPGTRLSASAAAALGRPARDVSATLEIEAFAREVARR